MIRLPDLTGLGASYALHVDVVMTASGPLRDAVVRIENGRFAEIAAAGAYANPAVPALRIRGGALVPGMLDIHHHIIEPFAKAVTCGEPAQMWKRIWFPLEATATPRTLLSRRQVDVPRSLAGRHHDHRRARHQAGGLRGRRTLGGGGNRHSPASLTGGI